MADFRKACDYVLHNEDSTLSGKVTKDPTRDAPDAVARFGVNSAKHADLVPTGFFDPAVVDREQALIIAEQVFQYDYFNHVAGYSIADQDVANKFSDLAFNEGAPQATKLVQRAIADVHQADPPIADDGIVGSRTIAAINACDPSQLLAAIRDHARKFYRDLVITNPGKYDADLPGWLARVNR